MYFLIAGEMLEALKRKWSSWCVQEMGCDGEENDKNGKKCFRVADR